MTSLQEMVFTDLNIGVRGIDVVAKGEEELALYFRFDREVAVEPTSVALALATLCGEKYARVQFDFPVASSALDAIRAFTAASVDVQAVVPDPPNSSRGGSLLSFSGGFDSLGARAVMPADTKLVSMQFGGWFRREHEFFRTFDTLTVQTNCRSVPSQQTSMARNHWSFMAIGALLTSEHFGAKYHTFGSILASSLKAGPPSNSTFPLLRAAGYIDARYTAGLTEAATVKILLQESPEVILPSLDSLASKRDRKRMRKYLLVKSLSKRFGALGVTLPNIHDEFQGQVEFGSDYATTLVGLYLISREGPEFVRGLFDAVPRDAIKLASSLSMDFMERFNADYYESFPAELMPDLGARLAHLNMRPYSQSDWREVEAVKEYMASLNPARPE